MYPSPVLVSGVDESELAPRADTPDSGSRCDQAKATPRRLDHGLVARPHFWVRPEFLHLICVNIIVDIPVLRRCSRNNGSSGIGIRGDMVIELIPTGTALDDMS
jgi:hypothetical protein